MFEIIIGHTSLSVLKKTASAMCAQYGIPRRYVVVQRELSEQSYLDHGEFIHCIYYNRTHHEQVVRSVDEARRSPIRDWATLANFCKGAIGYAKRNRSKKKTK